MTPLERKLIMLNVKAVAALRRCDDGGTTFGAGTAMFAELMWTLLEGGCTRDEVLELLKDAT